jgi:cytochrome c oxidase subunit IV
MKETDSFDKETLMLNGLCLLLVVVSLGMAVWAPLTSGLSVDNIFMVVLGLALAAVFAINPALTLANSPMVKEMVASMSAGTASEESHSHKIYYMIWGGLLVLTVIEITLIFPNLSKGVMLIILIGLSLMKSGMIMAYFMHLKFEKMSLVITLVPIMVILIGLFAVFFPDSLRVLNLGVYK